MQLSPSEFKALLFIHGSFIDYEFHPKEREYIINVCGLATFDKMMIIYLTERERSFGYLQANFDSCFPTHKSKVDLKDELFGLLLADSNYNQLEKAFMELYRSTLSVSSLG